MQIKNATALSGIQVKWFAVLAGVFCLAIATGASAEAVDRPCKEDAEKLCNGVQPGGGNIARCLKEHSSELSPACKDNITKAKEKAKEFKEACKDDAHKLCNGVQQGGGRILQCLSQHESELSPACKEQMDQPRGRM